MGIFKKWEQAACSHPVEDIKLNITKNINDECEYSIYCSGCGKVFLEEEHFKIVQNFIMKYFNKAI